MQYSKPSIIRPTAVLGTCALAASAVAGGAALAAAMPAKAVEAVVVNAGFEAGLEAWRTNGRPGTAGTETNDGGTHLTHSLAKEGKATTSQRLSKVEEGWWTVSARVKSGGGLESSRIGLRSCGTDGETVIPSTEQDNGWLQISADAYVTKPNCEIFIETKGPAGSWVNVDDVTLTAGEVERTVRGADLSGLAKNEDFGAQYFVNGKSVDAIEAFADAGANMARLKVWVDPADGYNTTQQVVASAKRAKAAGMQVLIDFHYSDRWTDPGAQGIPSAWVGLEPSAVAEKLYEHTHEVLTALKDAGVTADAVQIGNEINPGMLWPLGQTWDVFKNDGVEGAQWENLASFLSAGARAVKDVDPSTDVILHLTNINNGLGSLTWWFDEVTARGVEFDTIGLSYYGFWHGSMTDLQEAITGLSSRYDKDVLVVENAYPFTLEDDLSAPWENIIRDESQLVPGYPATPEGQAANFRAVQDVVASAPGGRGLGVVAWEPAWTAVPGNGWDPADPASGNAWENQAMFDFDGRALPALEEYAPDADVRR